MLERVLEDNRVVGRRLEDDVGERALAGVDAAGAGCRAGVGGWLDARRLPAAVEEPGGEVAATAAHVDDAAERRSATAASGAPRNARRRWYARISREIVPVTGPIRSSYGP